MVCAMVVALGPAGSAVLAAPPPLATPVALATNATAADAALPPGRSDSAHVDAWAPSQGCVEVPRASEVELLRWLDPAQHPRVTIGLG